MIEVKIFEDGEQIKQIEGEVIFAIAMQAPEDNEICCQSTIRGEASTDLLFRIISSVCTKHIASLSKSAEDGSRIAGEFIGNALSSSIEYLGEKYGNKGNKEEAEDGSIED